MKALFKGFISIDQNAVFCIEKVYAGRVISEKHFELKDGIDADKYVIGEEYDIEGLVKD